VVVVALGVLGVTVLALGSVVVEPEAPIDVPLPVAAVLGVVGVVAAVSVDGIGAGTLLVVDEVEVSVVTSFLPQAAMDRLRAAIRARAAQRATVFSCMGLLL
jgi:hypothetical protein